MSRHKQKLHGTNINSHGTNKIFTAQTKTLTAQTLTLTAEVIFAAEIKILNLHTSGYSVARNMVESVEPDDDFELGEEDEDSKESLIRYYFFRGFEYK